MTLQATSYQHILLLWVNNLFLWATDEDTFTYLALFANLIRAKVVVCGIFSLFLPTGVIPTSHWFRQQLYQLGAHCKVRIFFHPLFLPTLILLKNAWRGDSICSVGGGMAKLLLDLGLGFMCLGVRKPEVLFSTHNGGSFIPEK